MSQDNVEVVRRVIAAINERDVEAYLELCTLDAELVSPMAQMEGPSVGAEGIRRFFEQMVEATTEFHLDLPDLRPLEGDRVLAVGTVRTVSRGGFDATAALVNIYELEGGRMRRVTGYLDTDEGLRAAGVDG